MQLSQVHIQTYIGWDLEEPLPDLCPLDLWLEWWLEYLEDAILKSTFEGLDLVLAWLYKYKLEIVGKMRRKAALEAESLWFEDFSRLSCEDVLNCDSSAQ